MNTGPLEEVSFVISKGISGGLKPHRRPIQTVNKVQPKQLNRSFLVNLPVDPFLLDSITAFSGK